MEIKIYKGTFGDTYIEFDEELAQFLRILQKYLISKTSIIVGGYEDGKVE